MKALGGHGEGKEIGSVRDATGTQMKRKTSSKLRRGRIVEGVSKLSDELSVRVGDAGHGQMFCQRRPSARVRFGSDSTPQKAPTPKAANMGHG